LTRFWTKLVFGWFLGARLDYGTEMKTSSRPLGDSGVGQFEVLRARSLGPLVKARAFGMTPCKRRAKLIHYRRYLPVDLAGDFVLMSDYTGKEVVE
jgi:hypothetical protein